MSILDRTVVKWRRCRKAASAVEFAIMFPLFLAILFGIISFGAYLSVIHSVQQLAAEAARASVAGLNDSERVTLARSNIDANVGAYPLLSSRRLSLSSAATDPVTSTFSVTLTYDGSDMFIFRLPSFGPTPASIIVRTAAIQRGGY